MVMGDKYIFILCSSKIYIYMWQSRVENDGLKLIFLINESLKVSSVVFCEYEQFSPVETVITVV